MLHSLGGRSRDGSGRAGRDADGACTDVRPSLGAVLGVQLVCPTSAAIDAGRLLWFECGYLTESWSSPSRKLRRHMRSARSALLARMHGTPDFIPRYPCGHPRWIPESD